MSKKNIIYILSTGHSGSTLLEYYFSTYPGKVGLGEAYNAIKNYRKDGTTSFSNYDKKTVEKSKFWKHIFNVTNEFNSLEEHYRYLYKYINTEGEFSQYDTIIDSSKSMEALKILHSEYGENLKVALVIKDVRSWIVSQIQNKIRKKRKIPFMFNFRLIREWYSVYNRRLKDLESLGINHTIISYDLFCLDNSNIEEYLKNNFNLVGDANYSKTNSINILGNRMKQDANIELKIKYDYRWMKQGDWFLPWILTPKTVKDFNGKYVWSLPV